MPNHFHFIVEVKDRGTVFPRIKKRNQTDSGTDKDELCARYTSRQFNNLLVAYAKAINKQENRDGSLFKKNFKHKVIEDEKYLKECIMYVHLNPVHHNFTRYPSEWKYSSYNILLGNNSTHLDRQGVMELFGDKENFIYVHQHKRDFVYIKKLEDE